MSFFNESKISNEKRIILNHFVSNVMLISKTLKHKNIILKNNENYSFHFLVIF